MKKLVSTRQLIMMLLMSMVGIKVLVLPNLFSQVSGRDSYLFVIFMLLLDFIVLLTFLFLKNKFKEMSFYEILEYLFGKVVAKIIMFCFFAFFLTKCCAIFETNFAYLNENLYTTFDWVSFSLPILVVIILVSLQGVNAFARTCEILVPLVMFGLIVSVIVGSIRTDFSNLLPFMENGATLEVFNFSFWFGDFLIFMVFLGNVKMDKKMDLKICLSVFVTILIIGAMYAVFFAKFNNSSVTHSNAISDLIQASPSMSDVGSFDWVLILIWDIALFLIFSLNVLGALYSFRQVISVVNQTIVVGVITLSVLLIVYFNHFDIFFAIDFTMEYLKYPCIFIQYALPMLIFVVALFKRGKKDEVSVAK